MENEWEIGKKFENTEFFCAYNLQISHNLEKKAHNSEGVNL